MIILRGIRSGLWHDQKFLNTRVYIQYTSVPKKQCSGLAAGPGGPASLSAALDDAAFEGGAPEYHPAWFGKSPFFFCLRGISFNASLTPRHLQPSWFSPGPLGAGWKRPSPLGHFSTESSAEDVGGMWEQGGMWWSSSARRSNARDSALFSLPSPRSESPSISVKFASLARHERPL